MSRTRSLRSAVCATSLVALAACDRAAGERGAETAGATGMVQAWRTEADGNARLARQPDLALRPATGVRATARDSAVVLDVDRGARHQAMVGFGAAMTDASAWLLHERLTPPQRSALLQELFGRSGDGIALGMLRLTIGASDFSRAHETLADLPPGAPAGARDDSLVHFSIARDRDALIPVVRAALAVNPSLTIMATPWSAPAWMKSTGRLAGGTLRPDAYPAFAGYLHRYVRAYEGEGIPIALLSVQNEPHHEPPDYPGMRFDAAARADFVAHHLGPLFARQGVRTQLLDWDHNWDEPASPLSVLGDSAARRHVAGVAWHCYAGDVAAQSLVHDAHPDKDTWFTECAGGAWAPHWGDNLLWNVRTLVIGATRHWARGVMLWNLALDERHGPHTGGCNDCRGVVTIDAATGAVSRNEEYYALAHASRFVRPGAHRVASTSGVREVESVAFVHDDDGTLVLLVASAARDARALIVRDGGRAFRTVLPPRSVTTYTWR